MSPYDIAPHVYLPLPFLHLLVLALLLWRKPRLQRRIVAVTTVVFLLVSIPAVSRLMVLPLVPTTDTGSLPRTAPIAVVVPTAGIFNAGGERWWVDSDSLSRFASGQRLARRHGLPLIVSGGRTQGGAPSEAEVLVRQAKPTWPRVILETASHNTFETGRNVKAVLAKMNGGPVFLVTSPTHCLRSAAVFRSAGIETITVPSGNTRWLHREASFDEWLDLMPSAQGLGLANQALIEYAAIAWYLVNERFSIDDLVASF